MYNYIHLDAYVWLESKCTHMCNCDIAYIHVPMKQKAFNPKTIYNQIFFPLIIIRDEKEEMRKKYE